MSLVYSICLPKHHLYKTTQILIIKSVYHKMLSETKAIVVGGLGGIGSAICNSLLENHVQKLAIIDIHETLTLESFKQPNVLYVKCGIESRSALKDAFNKIWQEFDGFNLVINSAGIVNEQNAEKVFGINTLGAINCTCVAAEYMRKDKNGGTGGTILNIASMLSYLPYKGFPIYVASKHAVLGFMKSIGDTEFCNVTGLRFITVCPGYTDTPLIGSGIHELALEPQSEPFPPQSPNVVARCVLKSLETSKHSSFWRCCNGEISEIELLSANDV